MQAIHNKQYTAHGSRGQSVKQLTASNCTEDERYIFEYINKKREIRAACGADDEDRMSVDDDEFEAYLHGLAGKKKKKGKGDDTESDEEFDFLADLEGGGGDQGKPTKKPKQKSGDEADDDWDSDGSDVNEDGYVIGLKYNLRKGYKKKI